MIELIALFLGLGLASYGTWMVRKIMTNHLVHLAGDIHDLTALSKVSANRIIAATDAGTDQLIGLRTDLKIAFSPRVRAARAKRSKR